MSSIRFGRSREYQFFRQEDIRRTWDLRSAVQFLNRFRTDAVAMENFRRQVKKEITASSANLSDEQVIQSLARMLVSGEFMVAVPERQQHREPLDLRAPVTAPSAPRDRAPVEVVEDEPTFDQDHDGVSQAAVLIAAAQSGYAFCEECARHAAEQQASGPVTKPAAAPPPANQPALQPATANPVAKQDTNTPVANPAGNRPADQQEAVAPAAKQVTPAPGAPQQQTATPPAGQETTAKAVEKETFWVEIALIGEDGQPIPGEEFVVVLPDGKRETGFLDGNGLARFTELPTSGNCKVSFPQLDRDAWQSVPASGK